MQTAGEWYERTTRIAQLNGLRGIAILLVLAHHVLGGDLRNSMRQMAPGSLSVSQFLEFLPGWLSLHVSVGWVGVNLFFVLSGFVLFYPYANGKREISGWADVRFFLQRRARRLLPLLFLSSIIIVALKPGADLQGSLRSLLAVLTLAFPFIDRIPAFNPPVWSIGPEILFGIALPLLVVLARRIGVGRLFLGTLVLGFVARAYCAHLDAPNVAMRTFFLGRLDDFVPGMVVCQLFVSGMRIRWSTAAFFGGALLIYLGTLPSDLPFLVRHGIVIAGSVLVPAAPYLLALSFNVVQLGAALMILGALSGRGPLAWVLNFWPLQVLGIMTYSLYLWHLPVMQSVSQAGASLWWAGALLLVLTPLSHRFIEFYFDRDLRRIFGLSGTEPASAAAQGAKS